LADTVDEGTFNWEKDLENNPWKSSTLLFGGVTHFIGGIGWMRRSRLTQSNLVIGP